MELPVGHDLDSTWFIHILWWLVWWRKNQERFVGPRCVASSATWAYLRVELFVRVLEASDETRGTCAHIACCIMRPIQHRVRWDGSLIRREHRMEVVGPWALKWSLLCDFWSRFHSFLTSESEFEQWTSCPLSLGKSELFGLYLSTNKRDGLGHSLHRL
jgi:hypothetical protein